MSKLSDDKPSLADILYNNRKFVLAILGVPVFGMAIAAGLILYKRPSNTPVALGVILFVAIQYILTMFFWMKRVEKLAKKTPSTEPVQESDESLVSEEISESEEEILAPEERRVFPIDEE